MGSEVYLRSLRGGFGKRRSDEVEQLAVDASSSPSKSGSRMVVGGLPH